MKTKTLKQIFFLSLVVLLWSCSEEVDQVPLEANSIAPQQISNLQVENLKGKAKLTYTLPDDEDLLYIKANYTLPTGREMEVKASYYQNSMLLEGFTGNEDVEVEVVAVNRSEVASAPVTVTVNPLQSPIFDVYNSLDVGEAFGGIFVNAENPERMDIAILILAKNEQGEYVTDPNSIYTSTDIINGRLRGLDTLAQDFGLLTADFGCL